MNQEVKIKLETFSTIFPTFKDFQDKALTPISVDDNGEIQSWLKDNKFYTLKDLYNSFVDKYSYRQTYHQEKEFLGYFRNTLRNFLPRYYSRNFLVLQDEIKKITTDNLKTKTSLKSESKRSHSTNPYENTINSTDVADNFENNIYNLDTINPNILEAARLASLSRIGGELEKFLGSFNNLFTMINLTEKVLTSTVNRQLAQSILQRWVEVENSLSKGLIPWLTDKYADINEFGNNAADFEIVRYDTNPDGTPSKYGFVLLGKTPNGVISFRTYEELKFILDEAIKNKVQITPGNIPNGGLATNKVLIKAADGHVYAGDLDNFQSFIDAVNNISVNQNKIAGLESSVHASLTGGMYIGEHQGTNAADLSNFPSTRPGGGALQDGDYGLLRYVGATPSEISFQFFTWDNNKWNPIGAASASHPHLSDTSVQMISQDPTDVAITMDQAGDALQVNKTINAPMYIIHKNGENVFGMDLNSKMTQVAADFIKAGMSILGDAYVRTDQGDINLDVILNYWVKGNLTTLFTVVTNFIIIVKRSRFIPQGGN